MRFDRQLDQNSNRILEVNPGHPLIQRLAERIGASGAGEELETAARLLLDQARIVEGEPLADPVGFARRMSEMMAKGLAE